MVPAGRRSVRTCPCRPRAGGDGPDSSSRRLRARSSAPRRRGWSVLASIGRLRVRVGPAQAGMVPPPTWSPSGTSSQPRTRGDGPAATVAFRENAPSAPHPRGWSSRPGRSRPRVRVGPAPAGMVLGIGLTLGSVVRRPRTRRDDPRLDGVDDGGRPSAPHPRDGPPHPRPADAGARVGPAQAGMVPPCACS